MVKDPGVGKSKKQFNKLNSIDFFPHKKRISKLNLFIVLPSLIILYYFTFFLVVVFPIIIKNIWSIILDLYLTLIKLSLYLLFLAITDFY